MTTLFRHTLATLAYRASKALRGASPRFARFSAGGGARRPIELVAHLGDLMAWAHSIARGEAHWEVTEPEEWDATVARFYAELAAFDAYVASDVQLGAPLERLMQGPVADALTHVGQLAMLRRLAGEPVKGESYFAAPISIGRVGPEQERPAREF